MEPSPTTQPRSVDSLEDNLPAISGSQAEVASTCKDVKVGEVVLIKDETLRVRNWPLARVIKIFPGTDGITRAVDVRCSDHTYRRPVHMLVRLCADDTPPDDLQLNAEDQHSPPPPQDVQAPSRPSHGGSS